MLAPHFKTQRHDNYAPFFTIKSNFLPQACHYTRPHSAHLKDVSCAAGLGSSAGAAGAAAGAADSGAFPAAPAPVTGFSCRASSFKGEALSSHTRRWT